MLETVSLHFPWEEEGISIKNEIKVKRVPEKG